MYYLPASIQTPGGINHMQNDNIRLVIEATDGRPLRHYSHEGKTYLESHENREYQLRIKNLTNHRAKCVVSVDSLNVISGKPASNDPSETGYILAPHEEQIIRGYRIDQDTVAAFKFVRREASYATEKGAAQGNGVIAIRAYREKKAKPDMAEVWRKMYEEERNRPKEKEYIPYPVRPWYWEDGYWHRPYRPYRPWGDVWYGGCAIGGGSSEFTGDTVFTCASNNASDTIGGAVGKTLTSCSASVRSMSMDSVDEAPFAMGSTFGAAVKDAVKEVAFETGELLEEVVVYYTHKDGLKALGVDIERIKAVAFPEPFKKTFCEPPSGWKR